jgi:hypothetical protein
MTWVKCSERLPEPHIAVLTFEDGRILSNIGIGRLNKLYEFDNSIEGKITHWMPIPQPPKENE